MTERELVELVERVGRAEREYIAARAAWEIASRELNSTLRVGSSKFLRPATSLEPTYLAARDASERYDLAAEVRDAELDELKHAATVWLAEREAAQLVSSSVDNPGGNV